jgi:hypothetical protein
VHVGKILRLLHNLVYLAVKTGATTLHDIVDFDEPTALWRGGATYR